MFRSVDGNTGRIPKHDAPPYDPSVWEGKDCAFITTLKNIYHEQQRMERQLHSEMLVNGEHLPLLPVSHVQSICRPLPWWSKLLAKLFPRYYARQDLASAEFSRLSTDELVSRMHFALQAGNSGLSSLIAQELARRRATLLDNEVVVPKNGRRSTRSDGASMTDAQFRMVSGNQHISSNAGAGTARLSGLTFRGGVKPSEDASFVVPEILLRRRPVGGV